MRTLRLWLTTLLIFGMLMLMASPAVLMGKPAPDAPEKTRLRFAVFLTGYVIVELLIFAVVLFLAWRLIVKQREEYQTSHLQNLKELVESTLQDHERARIRDEEK